MGAGQTGTRMAMPRREASLEQTRVLSMPDLVSSITKGMTAAVTEILGKFTRPPPIDDVADAAIRECFQKRELQWCGSTSSYQQEWNPPPGSLRSTDLDIGRKLPRR